MLLDIESTIICIVLLLCQLLLLRWVDKRLDYAHMNHSYASDWGSTQTPDKGKVGDAVKRHRKRQAANDIASNDELPQG